MDLSELFTERKKVLSGALLQWILQGFDKRKRRKAGVCDTWKIDRGGRASETRHSCRHCMNQLGMPLRGRTLLQLVKSVMNPLKPFVRFLNEKHDQLFLEIICGVGSHDVSSSQ